MSGRPLALQKTLYKRSKSGKIQQWSVMVCEDAFMTTEGFIDGQLTDTDWTFAESKNVGRSTETTPEEQAIKEAEARIQKQRDKGWRDSVKEAETHKVKIAPMLAHKYEDHKDKLQGVILAAQPKLDGIRCIATPDGLFTRNGKQIVAAPHILAEVQAIFEANEGNDFYLDGELFNFDLREDFNQITSIVRKSKLTDEDIQKAENLLQYHIYDIDTFDHNPMPFHERIDFLEDLLKETPCKYLFLVETHFLNPTFAPIEDELDELYAKWLAQGQEGQMVRRATSLYENSRSKNLLKRKEFMTDEFVILDIEEGLGNRSKMMGRICLETKDGRLFDANARGTHEYFKELLINKQKYIGKLATVRFQNLTSISENDKGGVPRFPVVIDIDRNDL